jgi:HSP20 family molecular chaperone IbpA
MPELAVDILDRGGDLVLEVPLSGVLETDIDVTLAGRRLIVHAERPGAGGPSLLREIPRGLLVREVDLPEPVEIVEASFEDGLLRLVLRRREGGP